MNDLIVNYTQALKRFLKIETPILVVCDASNGSIGPMLAKLQDSKLHLILVNERPDGNFPAHGPNPLDPKAIEALSMEVKKNRADFGAVFDADGDRVVFVDNEGDYVSPDEVAYLLSEEMKSSLVLDIRMGQIFEGKKILRSPVGHFFVKNLMKKKRAEFGAEVSGHYYFKFAFKDGPAYFDSGLRAFVEFANKVSSLKASGGDLSRKIASLPRFFRSGELNFEVKNPSLILKKIESIYKTLDGEFDDTDGVTMRFKDGWWFNLRRSNTENVIRLNIEAKDPKIFKEQLEVLKGHISRIDSE